MPIHILRQGNLYSARVSPPHGGGQLLVDPVHVHVEVNGGVVRLEGTLARRSDADILPHPVRGLDGVVDVDSSLEYSLYDRHLFPSREL